MSRPRRIRIVSYAINGRGMGHLVRQLAILRWVRRLAAVAGVTAEAWVLTSSEADTLARREGVPALKMPSKAMLRDAGIDPTRYLAVARTWILNAVTGLQPDVLVVDTFPGGSFGELLPVLELVPRRLLVARRVRDHIAEGDAYRTLLPLYDALVTPDDDDVGPILLRERRELLDRDRARDALGIPGDARAVWVSLGGGGEVTAARRLPGLVDRLVAEGWHVVVGAGPLYDGPERRGPRITWLSRYAPVELLAGVDAAVAAAGYNTFHELMYAGVPTVFVPLERISDDQAARAARAQAAGAGRVAATWSDVPALLASPGDPEAARALVPHNGARKAALRVLAGLVPEADLQLADAVLSEQLVTLLGHTADPQGVLEVVRLLAGGLPSEHAQRQAALLALAAAGHAVPDIGSGPVEPAERAHRFATLCSETGPPFALGLQLLRGIARKFPRSSGLERLHAAERLYPALARFDDWMGALGLLRAVPTQRRLRLPDFVDALLAWLPTQEDLFDAQRALSRLEGAGERPIGEVLAILAPPDAEAS